MSVVIPNLGLPVPVVSPIAISYPPTPLTVLKQQQLVLATGYVETNVSQSLDDGLDHIIATLTIDARDVNSIVTVQAQSALAVTVATTATPVAKYFIINGVATPVVGYFCPDYILLNGANWSISGMAQSLEIPANTPIVIQWVLGGAGVGTAVDTGFTTMTATVTPGPSVVI